MPAVEGLYPPKQQEFLNVLDGAISRDEPDFDFAESIMGSQKVFTPYELMMELEGRRLYAETPDDQKNWKTIEIAYLDMGLIYDSDLTADERGVLHMIHRRIEQST